MYLAYFCHCCLHLQRWCSWLGNGHGEMRCQGEEGRSWFPSLIPSWFMVWSLRSITCSRLMSVGGEPRERLSSASRLNCGNFFMFLWFLAALALGIAINSKPFPTSSRQWDMCRLRAHPKDWVDEKHRVHRQYHRYRCILGCLPEITQGLIASRSRDILPYRLPTDEWTSLVYLVCC